MLLASTLSARNFLYTYMYISLHIYGIHVDYSWLSHREIVKEALLRMDNTVKPALKTNRIERAPAHITTFIGPQGYAFHVIEPVYKDHLCIRTTLSCSLWWSLYTSFTVCSFSADPILQYPKMTFSRNHLCIRPTFTRGQLSETIVSPEISIKFPNHHGNDCLFQAKDPFWNSNFFF